LNAFGAVAFQILWSIAVWWAAPVALVFSTMALFDTMGDLRFSAAEPSSPLRLAIARGNFQREVVRAVTIVALAYITEMDQHPAGLAIVSFALICATADMITARYRRHYLLKAMDALVHVPITGAHP
jgi:hypothetical protein